MSNNVDLIEMCVRKLDQLDRAMVLFDEARKAKIVHLPRVYGPCVRFCLIKNWSQWDNAFNHRHIDLRIVRCWPI